MTLHRSNNRDTFHKLTKIIKQQYSTFTSQNKYIVCIQGCSASGKSTLALNIKNTLEQHNISVYVIHLDQYYKSLSKSNEDIKGVMNEGSNLEGVNINTSEFKGVNTCSGDLKRDNYTITNHKVVNINISNNKGVNINTTNHKGVNNSTSNHKVLTPNNPYIPIYNYSFITEQSTGPTYIPNTYPTVIVIEGIYAYQVLSPIHFNTDLLNPYCKNNTVTYIPNKYKTLYSFHSSNNKNGLFTRNLNFENLLKSMGIKGDKNSNDNIPLNNNDGNNTPLNILHTNNTPLHKFSNLKILNIRLSICKSKALSIRITRDTLYYNKLYSYSLHQFNTQVWPSTLKYINSTVYTDNIKIIHGSFNKRCEYLIKGLVDYFDDNKSNNSSKNIVSKHIYNQESVTVLPSHDMYCKSLVSCTGECIFESNNDMTLYDE
ncbi:hypothetical protein CWI36_1410p0020 [Hamiltosporidium magnivora]|uniref:Phosphoribulokinase/uridine kinase domain-containing protein n=1 Tax=Hamiltosporidium magnivora TaxID=148818 RepID=A0A4Q9L2V9_9MICR|nr:hypothetical protein CWI36_1410p0020 [Hamiltosporidium magnivora]